MTQTIREALHQAQLYTDDKQYQFVSLPPNAVVVAASIVAEAGDPFMALIVDKDEVTLMIEQEHLAQFQKRLRDATVSDIKYRLITFDVALDPNLIGFIAHISAQLAEANISIMPFAAFQRDHIFVPEDDFEQAMTILTKLQKNA